MVTNDSIARTDRPIRVVAFQPALPHYRVPVFRELASRPGIEFRLVYGNDPNAPSSAPASDFEATHARSSWFSAGGVQWLWQAGQWRAAALGQADVLLLSWNIHYLSLIPTLLRARANGIGTVLWGHGYSKRKVQVGEVLRSRLASLGDALLFYNHTAAARYQQTYGWDPSRLHVALNALDQSGISAARNSWLSRPDELQRFRVNNDLADRQNIVFVSRLEQANRVDVLLQAVRLLRRNVPGIQALIIGKGPDLKRLQSLASDLGVQQQVRFLGAIYDEMNLAPWLLSSRVFCYPANIGLSILHAFGYGLPVVTGDALGRHNPEIEALIPGENGLLFADGEPTDLAMSLQRILQSPSLQQELAAGALRTVEERFTLKRMVDGMERAIRCAAQCRSSESCGEVAPLPPPQAPCPRAAPKSRIAILANSHTPYRQQMHKRLARELTGAEVWTLYTHTTSNAPWAFDVDPQIRPVLFGPGESSGNQGNVRFLLHEWRKAGRIIHWLQERNVKAVISLGYNDVGRLRLLRWTRRSGIPSYLWGDSNIRGDHATGLRRWLKRSPTAATAARVHGGHRVRRAGRRILSALRSRPRVHFCRTSRTGLQPHRERGRWKSRRNGQPIWDRPTPEADALLRPPCPGKARRSPYQGIRRDRARPP